MAFKSLVAFLRIALAAHAATTGRVKCPDGNVASHSACCPFFALRDDLQNNAAVRTLMGHFVSVSVGPFPDGGGVRLLTLVFFSFSEDAVAFSPALKDQGLPAGGGADGSMLIFPNVEPNFQANLGISDSVELLTPFISNHTRVSAGDLIQFAAAVAIGNCPGVPSWNSWPGVRMPQPPPLMVSFLNPRTLSISSSPACRLASVRLQCEIRSC
ncbi:heme peroxidase [Gautieria morchelliformis]|nr:heme peroxidase [Gautieria morchelliformis]